MPLGHTVKSQVLDLSRWLLTSGAHISSITERNGKLTSSFNSRVITMSNSKKQKDAQSSSRSRSRSRSRSVSSGINNVLIESDSTTDI